MRGGDAERYADEGRGHRRDDDQRERLEGRLPVPLVHDEEQRRHHERRERPGAAQEPGERGGAEHQERGGDGAQERREPVDARTDHGRHGVEEHPAVGLHVLDEHRDRVADGELVVGEPALEAERAGEFAGRAHGLECGTAGEGVDALQPRGHGLRVRLEEVGRRHLRRFVAIEHVGHHAALLLRREGQIAQQAGYVGTLLQVAGARVGVNGRLAEVGPEDRVAARQIAQVKAHVHGMRIPGEEYDRGVRAVGALDLR